MSFLLFLYIAIAVYFVAWAAAYNDAKRPEDIAVIAYFAVLWPWTAVMMLRRQGRPLQRPASSAATNWARTLNDT